MTEPKPVKAWAVVTKYGPIEPECQPVERYRHVAESKAVKQDQKWPVYAPHRVIPVTITPGHEAELPADVVRLVIAARQVAFGDPLPESIKELDAASEAFADRVGWEYDPNEAEDD